MNSWFHDYAKSIALYGGAVMSITFLTGYLDEATAFIRADRALSVTVLVVHFCIFWIDRIAAKDQRRVRRLRKGLKNDQ